MFPHDVYDWWIERYGRNLDAFWPVVDTPLGRHTSAGRPSRSAAGVPFGRMATGWEIAYAVLFFLSDESVYVTGQTVAGYKVIEVPMTSLTIQATAGTRYSHSTRRSHGEASGVGPPIVM